MSKKSAWRGAAESSGNSSDLGKPQHNAAAAVSFIVRSTFSPAIEAASSTERRCGATAEREQHSIGHTNIQSNTVHHRKDFDKAGTVFSIACFSCNSSIGVE